MAGWNENRARTLRNEWPYGNPVTKEPETHRASHRVRIPGCFIQWIFYTRIGVLQARGVKICQERCAKAGAENLCEIVSQRSPKSERRPRFVVSGEISKTISLRGVT